MNQMYQNFVCITCHLLQKGSVRTHTQIHHNSNVPACGIVSFCDWDSEFSNWSSTIYISHISHIFTISSLYIPTPKQNPTKPFSDQIRILDDVLVFRPTTLSSHVSLSRSLYIMVVYFSICSCGIMRITIPCFLPYLITYYRSNHESIVLIQAVSTCKWLYQVRFCVAVQADTCIMNHNTTLLQYGTAMGTYSWSTHDHSSGRIMIMVITRKLQCNKIKSFFDNCSVFNVLPDVLQLGQGMLVEGSRIQALIWPWQACVRCQRVWQPCLLQGGRLGINLEDNARVDSGAILLCSSDMTGLSCLATQRFSSISKYSRYKTPRASANHPWNHPSPPIPDPSPHATRNSN